MQGEIGFHPAAIAATTDAARAGRDEADLELVADPARTRANLARIVQGPDFPRRLEVLNGGFDRAYAALGRADWELNTLSMHPDAFVFENGGGDRAAIDLPSRLDGVEAYIAGMTAFGDGWGEATLRSEAVADAGAGRLFNLARYYLRGSGSGIALEQPLAQLFMWEDGWLVLQRYWWDVEAGTRAAGVDAAALESRP